MALSLKTILPTLLLALTLYTLTLAPTPATARQLTESTQTEPRTLMARLNSDENSTSCWDSMFKLQACTGEVIQFFYNGEAFLGPECCHAVHVIVHDCWPTMLGSLGFTSEEGDILRGYCDAEENRPTPFTPSPPHAVAPTKDVTILIN